MFYTYILKSTISGRYYIGCTGEIESRLARHNKGFVRSTKAYRPWELLYKEEFETLAEARKRERRIKSWKSRETIEKLIHAPFV